MEEQAAGIDLEEARDKSTNESASFLMQTRRGEIAWFYTGASSADLSAAAAAAASLLEEVFTRSQLPTHTRTQCQC